MVGLTCSTQWEDEECVWIKKPQGWKSLVRSVDRLKVILNNRISSKLWNNGNAGGEASNPIPTANLTASCVPLTLFFSNQPLYHEIVQIAQCFSGIPVVLHVLSICAVTPTARSILVSPDS